MLIEGLYFVQLSTGGRLSELKQHVVAKHSDARMCLWASYVLLNVE